MVWARLASAATAFGQTVVRVDGPVPDRLTRTWAATQDRLPEGWDLDGLRCVSTGLSADSRSSAWVAVAIGPAGEERTNRAEDAVAALEGLAASFEPD